MNSCCTSLCLRIQMVNRHSFYQPNHFKSGNNLDYHFFSGNEACDQVVNIFSTGISSEVIECSLYCSLAFSAESGVPNGFIYNIVNSVSFAAQGIELTGEGTVNYLAYNIVHSSAEGVAGAEDAGVGSQFAVVSDAGDVEAAGFVAGFDNALAGSVSVVHDNVSALFHHSKSYFVGLNGIGIVTGHVGENGDAGVNGLNACDITVQSVNDGNEGNGADSANDLGFSSVSGSNTCDEAHLSGKGVDGCQVRAVGEVGGSYDEGNFGEVFCNDSCSIIIFGAVTEDYVVAGVSIVAESFFSVGNGSGFHIAGFATIGFFDCEEAFICGEGPALIIDGAGEDDSNLQIAFSSAFTVSGAFAVGSSFAVSSAFVFSSAAAAGDQGQNHYESQEQGKKLFHCDTSIFLHFV